MVKSLKLASWMTSTSLLLFAASCSVPREPQFDQWEASRPNAAVVKALARGDVKGALAYFESQAQEAEKNAAASSFPQGYWEAASWGYTAASLTAKFSGQLQKAITYGEKAVGVAEKTKSADSQLRAIRALIFAYNSVSNVDKTKDLLERWSGIVKELPPNTNSRIVWEGYLYQTLGEYLIGQREYDKAIDAFSQSVYLTRDWLAGIYGARGGQFPARIAQARNAIIEAVVSLGDAYRLAGKSAQAVEQYQYAANAIREWGLKPAREKDLYQSVGEVYFVEQNFTQALENFQKAFALGILREQPTVTASRRIGDVLWQTGKPNEAIPHYQTAIQQIESARALLESQQYRQSYFEASLQTYFSLINAFLKLGRLEEAFHHSERARSRVFLDVLGSKVQLSRAKSGLFEEERTIQERIAGIRARLAGGEDDDEEEAIDRGSLQRELREAERAYNGFLARVRKEDKEQASLMTVEPLTLKEVQELLDPGTSLVEYFVAGRDIFVWVINKDGMQFVTVPLPRDNLASLVKELRETIFTVGETQRFNRVSVSLYRHLVQEVLPHIKGKELIIVPHDVLHYLPFHALLSPDGRYLIEDYPIYYLSSASLLQFVKDKRRAKGEKVLAFGNPDLGDPNKDLKFAELEAQGVKDLYPQSTLLVRKEATEEKSKALSPGHDILHFATHAELKEEDPLSSAILLAKDGTEDRRLEVREIFQMDLKANLVVLSACETGLGKLSTGDELVGLTRAFIYAGAPSVIASLWKVEDDTTAALMASFYRNLKTMSKVEALRQAQLELIRGEGGAELLAKRGVGGIGKLGAIPVPNPQSQASGPSSVSTSHPYFWAPFILVGDGE